MGSRVQCFMLERTDLARRSLRRYTNQRELTPDACPLVPGKYSYHNAGGVVIVESEPFDSIYEGDGTQDMDHSDPRWPLACRCGYVFLDSDAWQVNLDRLYRDARDGRLYTTREAPAGAMWFSCYYAEKMGCRGPDGQCLTVKLPDGTEWHVDCPASNSNTPWDRTGTPPLVTARPSIASPRYHGFLTDGFLEEV